VGSIAEGRGLIERELKRSVDMDKRMLIAFLLGVAVTAWGLWLVRPPLEACLPAPESIREPH